MVNPAVTSERLSPMNVVTVQADYVIVSPTLPPSKTPTQTPTTTTTPPITLTPTITVTSSMTAPTFPTPIFSPTVAVVSNPVNEVCLSQWQYIQPPPPGCPFAPATVGRGVYQEFERGYMFWVPPNQIYVLYRDGATPYWLRYNDFFNENVDFVATDWKDPNLDLDPSRPPNTYQPRRGFGKLWRENPIVKARVGWATEEWKLEDDYNDQRIQTRTDGTIFISAPTGRYYQLTPGGLWQEYAGATSPYVYSPASPMPPSIPLP
jgi:hypothetical protein